MDFWNDVQTLNKKWVAFEQSQNLHNSIVSGKIVDFKLNDSQVADSFNILIS